MSNEEKLFSSLFNLSWLAKNSRGARIHIFIFLIFFFYSRLFSGLVQQLHTTTVRSLVWFSNNTLAVQPSVLWSGSATTHQQVIVFEDD